MIVYQLACANGHPFEGWFASAQACEEQAQAGQLACPSCASDDIRRMPSAPYVKGSQPSVALRQPSDEGYARREALQALRAFILSHTENVGRDFPEVARRIHYGEEAERAIRGQVTRDEAVELREEGIEAHAVAPGVLPPEEVH